MPHYISLMRYTQKGLAEIKDSPARAKASAARVAALGGHSVAIWLTMGTYDLVQVFEMPSDEAMMQYLLTARADGYVEPLVLKALESDDMRTIIANN